MRDTLRARWLRSVRAEQERSHEDSKCQYPDPEQDHILGICTGALAASAVSCSCNTLDLVPLGVEAIIVAFRTGVHVHDTAQRIEPSQDLDQSWSMIVGGEEAAGMVEAFCEQSVGPTPETLNS